MNFLDIDTTFLRMHPKRAWSWLHVGFEGHRQSIRQPIPMFKSHWGNTPDMGYTYYELSLQVIRTHKVDQVGSWYEAALLSYFPPNWELFIQEYKIPSAVVGEHYYPGWVSDWHAAMSEGNIGKIGPDPVSFYVLCHTRYVVLHWQSHALWHARHMAGLDMKLNPIYEYP